MKGGINIYNYYNRFNSQQINQPVTQIRDYGPYPIVFNMKEMTLKNTNYRSTLWTGNHLQLTLMSIRVGGDIGFEIHPDVDQFIRIEGGNGVVLMGDSREIMNIQENVSDNMAFIIPAGKWHYVINTGNNALKLYSIYAPVQHPHGTVQQTKEIAQLQEDHSNRYYYKNSSY